MENMVKMRSLVVGSLFAWTGLAHAQVPSFEGLSVQGGTGYQRHAPVFFDYKTSGVANGLTAQTDQTKGVPVVMSVSYTLAFTDYVSLGLAYDHHLTGSSAARQRLYTNGSYSSGGTIRFKDQTQWSIVSGVLLDASTMVYAKLGTAQARSDSTNDNGSAAQNFDFSGWAWGLGAKRFVSQHQFAFAEYNQVRMSDTLRTSATDATATLQTSSKGSVLLVGMGWQF